MQSPGDLDIEVRVWAAARNVFWNHTAGLILPGPSSDSSAYVMDPADIWPSPGSQHCTIDDLGTPLLSPVTAATAREVPLVLSGFYH